MPGTTLRIALLTFVSLSAAAPGSARAGEEDRLYEQAHGFAAAGDAKAARRAYERLLAEHGASPVAGRARFALAELLFTQAQHDEALAHYLRVADTRGAADARYKAAWCHLHRGRAEEAIETFARSVREADVSAMPAARRAALVRESKRDLAAAYARAARPPEKAADFFGTFGQADVVMMLERLGDAYLEGGRARPAVETFHELLVRDVRSPDLCAWQAKAMQAVMSGGRADEMTAEWQRFGAVLAQVSATPSADAAKVCRSRYRDAAKALAMLLHKRGQKAKDRGLLAHADPVYRDFLRRFEKDSESHEMAFYYGDLQWTLARWEAAADAYRRSIDADPKGKHLREAAYGYVLAVKNAVDEAHGGKPPRPSLGEPLPADVQRVLDAMSLYLRVLPDERDVAAGMRFRRARTYADWGRWDAAIPALREVFERHPEHEVASFAAVQYLAASKAAKVPGLCADIIRLSTARFVTRDRAAAAAFDAEAAKCVDPMSAGGSR